MAQLWIIENSDEYRFPASKIKAHQEGKCECNKESQK